MFNYNYKYMRFKFMLIHISIRIFACREGETVFQGRWANALHESNKLVLVGPESETIANAKKTRG